MKFDSEHNNPFNLENESEWDDWDDDGDNDCKSGIQLVRLDSPNCGASSNSTKSHIVSWIFHLLCIAMGAFLIYQSMFAYEPISTVVISVGEHISEQGKTYYSYTVEYERDGKIRTAHCETDSRLSEGYTIVAYVNKIIPSKIKFENPFNFEGILSGLGAMAIGVGFGIECIVSFIKRKIQSRL